MATNQIRMDEMKHQMSRQGWNKAPQRLVTPEECLELCPLIDLEAANVIFFKVRIYCLTLSGDFYKEYLFSNWSLLVRFTRSY